MHNLKALFAVLVAVSVSIAQSVNISGIVKDSAGVGIAGAAVKLEKGGQTATTGSDGSFTLTGSGAGISSRINQALPHTPSATIHNGLLYVNLAEKSAVEITTFDLNGKALSTVQQAMDAGAHSIALPHRGAGVYLYKVKSGSSEFVIESNSFGGVSQGTAVSVQGSSSYNALAKQAKIAVAINDVIAVTKDGYLIYRVIVTNFDTSGIEIKMIVSAGTVTDADGNVYQTVRLGTQVWTVENLRTTKYNDGTPVTLDISNATWYLATAEKYCYYNNTTNADTITKFGALYNWYAVNTNKLAPAGWHVPTDVEWAVLENYLVINGYNWDGSKATSMIAKSMAAKTDWFTSTFTGLTGTIGNDLTFNNRSGFSALPGGFRGEDGYFNNVGNYGYWWSATENDASLAFSRYLTSDSDALARFDFSKSRGFSVRLCRDN